MGLAIQYLPAEGLKMMIQIENQDGEGSLGQTWSDLETTGDGPGAVVGNAAVSTRLAAGQLNGWKVRMRRVELTST